MNADLTDSIIKLLLILLWMQLFYEATILECSQINAVYTTGNNYMTVLSSVYMMIFPKFLYTTFYQKGTGEHWVKGPILITFSFRIVYMYGCMQFRSAYGGTTTQVKHNENVQNN